MKNLLLLLGMVLFATASILLLPRRVDPPTCGRLTTPFYDPATRLASEVGRPNGIARTLGQPTADRRACD